jgi:hypothetical protein
MDAGMSASVTFSERPEPWRNSQGIRIYRKVEVRLREMEKEFEKTLQE